MNKTKEARKIIRKAYIDDICLLVENAFADEGISRTQRTGQPCSIYMLTQKQRKKLATEITDLIFKKPRKKNDSRFLRY